MNVTWFVIRGSGFTAFALLTASMLWGLMVSSKVFGRAIKAKGLQWLHESLGLAAVLATAVHIVALTMDEFIGFGWADVLVPGVAEWRPLPVALGVVAFWSLVLVSFSFYVKKWIGQSLWKTIHYLSFGVFVSALIHGVFSGTDTSNPIAVALYFASTLAVVLLMAIRIVGAKNPPQRTTRTRAAEPKAAAVGAQTGEETGAIAVD